jgi:type IV pilus assembly protein PilB
MPRKRLGDILLEMSIITEAQLEGVLQVQKTTKVRLGELLIEQGLVTEQQIIEILEFQLGIPHISLVRYKIDPQIVRLIPEDLARRYAAIAVRRDRQRLTVAMADPLDFYAIDDLRLSTGFSIDAAISSKDEIESFIERYYGISDSVDELKTTVVKDEALESQVTDEDAPIVRLVNQIIQQGVHLRASDIHVDPSPNGVKIRYRVDGILQTEQILPVYMHSILTARIKIMAQMNIAEKRLPQDGRIEAEVNYRTIDIRVSTLPTAYGEKSVLRLLDRRNALFDIEQLGMSDNNSDLFKKMIHSPGGIVLLTGPTGSGKSSTLYAALKTIATDDKNVITIEDPIEYQIPGVNQMQVQHAIGLTFARGLRSILRQDPDIIMVGEMRDAETAEVAVRAALTGHLVMSTLHTNDAVTSIVRLSDMGIEPFLIASSLVGVVAQRLVRRVCQECAEKYIPSDYEEKWLSNRGFSVNQLVRGRGCSYCHKTGYQGRLAIQELLPVDDAIRGMILERKPDAAFRTYVKEQGIHLMLHDGLNKAAAGLTTIAEVLRVAPMEG